MSKTTLKSLASAAAVGSALAGVTLTTTTAPAVAQTAATEVRSEASLGVVMDFLSNTAPDKVEAAAERLVAPDATYISLNFSNPELQQILPWTGTDKGPIAYSSTFMRVANYWTIEDFTVTDSFAAGEDVTVFGSFTYRSVAVDQVFTSPFSIHAKVQDGKMVYFQFMEDTYASASSFRQSGNWTVQTTVDSAPFLVGIE